MDIFEKAQKALRKYISENKDKVRQDLEEMRKRSENSGDVTVDEYIELVRNLNLHNVSVSVCYNCGKNHTDTDKEHGMCHKCHEPIIEQTER